MQKYTHTLRILYVFSKAFIRLLSQIFLHNTTYVMSLKRWIKCLKKPRNSPKFLSASMPGTTSFCKNITIIVRQHYTGTTDTIR
jgi:hypothetical protein